jgi:hypothetical protein
MNEWCRKKDNGVFISVKEIMSTAISINEEHVHFSTIIELCNVINVYCRF